MRRPTPRLLLRLRTRQRPRLRAGAFQRMIPNLLTMLGLCSGLTAMRFALEGRFGSAAVAIAVSGCIDGLDGRIARLLKATSRFGAEFDSLADFLCFGVAPAFMLYLWSLQGARGFGFMPCLMFAVCMALRLARFNASIDSGPRPAYQSGFFTGVPAPAGAGLALFPLFVALEAHSLGWTEVEQAFRHPMVSAVVLTGTAFLLVSTLPVWSGKNVRLAPRSVLPVLLGTGLYAALLVADPWAAFAAAGVAYVCLLPFSLRDYRRKSEAANE